MASGSKLRRLYGAASDPDHDDFSERLEQAGLKQFVYDKAAPWLAPWTCPKDAHAERCEVGLVLKNCDVLGETVEAEFERIQRWYWNPRFSVDASIKDLIVNYRTRARSELGRRSNRRSRTSERLAAILSTPALPSIKVAGMTHEASVSIGVDVMPMIFVL